jgi:hypothetical protein
MLQLYICERKDFEMKKENLQEDIINNQIFEKNRAFK